MKNKSTIKFKETEIGPIPEEWNIVTLGESVEIVDGDRGANYPNGSDFSNDGYCLFLNAKNVCGNGFDFSDQQFITEEKDKILRKGKLKRGDLVLTTRGTVGNIAFYNDSIPFDNLRINSGMVILRNREEFDSKFLFQLLKSKQIKQQIIELTTGSAQPQLPIKDLKNLKLIKPPITEQKKIAEILFSIDEKLDLNIKMDLNLEKLINLIFKKWFIDSDNLSKDLIPGTFRDVVSEINIRIKNELKDVCVLSAVSSGNLIRSEDFFTKQVFSKNLEKYKKVEKFDFAYNPSRINIGSIGMLEEDIIGAVSSIYVVFRPKKEYHFFAQCSVKLGYVKNYIEKFSSGSVRQALNFDDFSSIPINIPPIELVRRFNIFITDIKAVRNKITKENEALTSMYDSIMPRLLSGKIQV
jgi:type I restriction enzyme S subunit